MCFACALAIQYPDPWGRPAIPNKENSPPCPGWGGGANIDRRIIYTLSILCPVCTSPHTHHSLLILSLFLPPSLFLSLSLSPYLPLPPRTSFSLPPPLPPSPPLSLSLPPSLSLQVTTPLRSWTPLELRRCSRELTGSTSPTQSPQATPRGDSWRLG